MAERMQRLSSSPLKHRLWRFAMMATPLPFTASRIWTLPAANGLARVDFA
jgi:hypothetical protein